MRQIKFRAWDFEEAEMIQLEDLLTINGSRYLNESLAHNEKVTFMQFTGLTDRNGVEIYEGDILNIYYTSSSCVDEDNYNHDGLYVANIGALGGLAFKFKGLFWSNYGHNQYPLNSTLSQEYKSLSYRYSDDLGRNELRAIDGSTYFEVIGNIYQNPELLERNQ